LGSARTTNGERKKMIENFAAVLLTEDVW